MSLRSFLRQLLCGHALIFEKRLPEIGGMCVIQARCIFCGVVKKVHRVKIIG